MNGARLILTSRYLKSGSSRNISKRKNYTKYIATRETVELRDQQSFHDANAPVTQKQKELIRELLNDFPESKNYLEYGDYTSYPTVGNASELISAIMEQNIDIIGNRKNFVGYMAMRPGAEKRGAHGLFNESDKPIVLHQVADEIANHPGNVWSHVVSLRRGDAVRLGYDNSDAWRELVKRHMTEIADAHNIPLCSLKWYAAFHNTTHHPHIHLLVYSADPEQGYLTRNGIEKMRSVFANDIFHEELSNIYQEQTVSRDDLKKLSETRFNEILKQIQNSEIHNPNLEQLIKTLHAQLKKAKGRKVYGYLPKEVKRTVNEIFAELAKDDRISQLYENWCQLEKLKYKSYSIAEPELPPLFENKTFHSVRNMIVRAVLKMDYLPEESQEFFDYGENFSPDDFIWNSSDVNEIEISDFGIAYQLKWSKEYKHAHELLIKKNPFDDEKKKCLELLTSESEKGNVLALYDLGKLYESDEEKSQEYYQKALQGFLDLEILYPKKAAYLQYRISQMYAKGLGTEQDEEKALEWLEKSAENGNQNAKYQLAKFLLRDTSYYNVQRAIKLLEETADKNHWASFLLGRLYLFGARDLERNREQSVAWLTKSMNGGNPYAEKLLQNMEHYEHRMLTETAFGLFVGLSRIIEKDYHRNQKRLSSQVDGKLRRMIQKKKKELGIKEESNQQQNY